MINIKIEVFITMESNKLERAIEKMVESHFKNLKKPDNFYGIKADVYPTKYGKHANITLLMKETFSMVDSDYLESITTPVKDLVKKLFGDYLMGGVSSLNSTIDNYNSSKWWYEDKKKVNENLKTTFIITESQYKVIKEESERDYTNTITNLLKKIILSEYKGIVCDIKVTHPKDREVLDGQKPYLHYKINVYFIGGYGSNLFPRTQAVAEKYDKIMDTIWSTIYDYLNIATDVYKTFVPKCEDESEVSQMNEEVPDRYKKRGFTKVGVKKRASSGDSHKWEVLAKKGDKYKIVKGGYRGMKDFTQHKDPQRRKNFWSRMGGKDSAKANDPFSPLYWHKRFGTW
jgi:DNA-directed RNA polymerase subunit L